MDDFHHIFLAMAADPEDRKARKIVALLERKVKAHAASTQRRVDELNAQLDSILEHFPA
jgi:hypothetical protein